MNRVMNRHFLIVLALVALGILMAGCGSQAPVETDPTEDMSGAIREEVTPVVNNPVQTEDPVDNTPDYSTMTPADFGVEDIFFAFDKYDLDREAMSILSRTARILREVDVVVMISGHCDERGTVDYNMALSEKRALAVRDYLVSLGVPSRNLRTTSFGKSKPFAYGHNEDAWAKNRRAHFERP